MRKSAWRARRHGGTDGVTDTGTDGVTPGGQDAGQTPDETRDSRARAIPSRSRPVQIRSDQVINDLHGGPSEQTATAAAARESVGVEIATLESSYAPGVASRARAACAKSRRSGQMSDRVWLAVLRQLATRTVEDATHAMTEFAERYADGDRDERYMLAIRRRNGSNGEHEMRPPAPPEAFPSTEESWRRVREMFGPKPDDEDTKPREANGA